MSLFSKKDAGLEKLALIIKTELAEIVSPAVEDYAAAPELLEADLKLIRAVVLGAFKHRDEGMTMEWEFAEAVDQLRGKPPA